jgi:hypothetical protein
VEKRLQISFARRVILLILGMTMICFAISPRTVAGSAMDIESAGHAKEVQKEDSNKTIQAFYVAYDAIVPVTQLHLTNDLLFVFDLFVLEEKDAEPSIEKPLFVNNHFKILFSRIISPNAP